jgi:DNA repair protein RecO (recombination protein O)
MLHKTRGIVFHYTDYSETSIVAKIYTELFGLQSYIVNSVRKKNAKVKQHLFQPLTLVEMVVYHKERGGLQRIAEVRARPVLTQIPFNTLKSSIVLFLNEVLYKSIREEESNPSLFDFLFNTIQLLDLLDLPSNDFHLLFLIQLTKYLGFFPSDNYDKNRSIFNLQDGEFQNAIPPSPLYLAEPMSGYFFDLIRKSPNLSASLHIPISEKRQLLERILEYYQLHVAGFGTVKSHKILESVWN